MLQQILEIFIGKKYNYQSSLGKNEFLLKLRELVEFEDEKDKFKRKPFMGSVDQNILQICENVLLLQAFSAFLHAKIKGNEQGCRLSGRIRTNRWVAIVLCFFLVFLIGVSMVLVFMTGMDEFIDLIMLLPVFILLLILLMVFISVRTEINHFEEILQNRINF